MLLTLSLFRAPVCCLLQAELFESLSGDVYGSYQKDARKIMFGGGSQNRL